MAYISASCCTAQILQTLQRASGAQPRWLTQQALESGRCPKPIHFKENTMFTPEQVLAAQKANLETLHGLTAKAFEGMEKLVELNMQATRAALAESASHTQAVLSVKDAQELIALQASLFQPMAEKAAAYSRHLYDIASGTTSEFSKAFESKVAEGQATFTNLVDNAAKNAPAGSETAVAMMKSAVAAANNAFESVQKAVKQASDVAEANFNAVTTNAVKTAASVGKKAR